MKVYGRSDIESVSTGCTHAYKKASAPTSWDQDRTVPVSDCANCEAALIASGWVDDPRKVQLTPAEAEKRDLAKEEGDALTHTMAQQFGAMLAANVSEAKAKQAVATRARAKKAGIEVAKKGKPVSV